MAPYRVLHFARLVNRYDFIDNIVRFADPSRFRMMVCTLTGESNIADPDYASAGIPHWVLAIRDRRQYGSAILKLAALLRRERVDLLHTHHYDEAFLGVLAGRLAGVPVVLGRHYHDELYLLASGARLRALLAVEGLCNRLARIIVVPSAAIRDLLVERQHVAREKVRLVPYGFDFASERYQPAGRQEALSLRTQLGPDGAFLAGNFGRHHQLKGQDYLLRGFADFARRFPCGRLVMVGTGPAHASLRVLARQLGLDRQVHFLGWRTDVGRLLQVVDVAVHPTLHEAFPQLMVEALAHARPLIITKVSGVSDHLQDGVTARLVPARDARALASALEWVANHADEARELGERGSRYVREHLDIRRVIGRYEACYLEAIER